MSSVFALLAIIAAAFLPGALIVLLFVPAGTRPGLKLIFAALVLGTALSGWQALLLAELGAFSMPALAAVWLVTLAVLLSLVWRRAHLAQADFVAAAERVGKGSLRPQLTRENWLEILILLAWLGAASWLFFRPHEAIMGGADAGVYVSLGAEIAQQGGFRIVDETLAGLDPALYPVFLRPLPANPIADSYLVPGFYVTDAAAGEIVPQFYPLYPVWLAVAYSLAGSVVSGIYAELLLTGLWMLLATLAVTMTARELGGWPAALLTLLGLSILALQVWFARYPTTEAMTQFLLWAGLWATVLWLGRRPPSSLWAFLSGVSLGLVFLVRIDILIILPLFGLLIVALWARGWQKSDWWFLIPFSVLVAQSLIHGVLLTAPYFYEHIGFGLLILWQNLFIPVTAILLGLFFLAAVYVFRGRLSLLGRYRRPFLAVMIGAVLLYAVYGWFIRPLTAEAVLRPDQYSESLILLTNHENWRRLGWYFSSLGIGLGVLGGCLLLWRAGWKTALLLAVGFLFTAVYLWNVRANPHQIYVMRRYVPAVAPFFILTAAYLLSELLVRARRTQDRDFWMRMAYGAVGLLLSAAWLLGLAWSARGFISQVDHQGVISQLASLNDALPPDSILLFNDQAPVGRGDFWGTPLKFIFGHDAFTIRDSEALSDGRLAESIRSWQNNGRAVVWIGDPGWLQENGFQFQQHERTIQSQRMESSYEHKPQAIVPEAWALPWALIE